MYREQKNLGIKWTHCNFLFWACWSFFLLTKHHEMAVRSQSCLTLFQRILVKVMNKTLSPIESCG